MSVDCLTHTLLTRLSRPVDSQGQRVAPSDLEEYRQTHLFRGPGCLCPLSGDGTTAFVEAALHLATDGRLAGRYVAICAKEACGYIGKSYRCGFEDSLAYKYAPSHVRTFVHQEWPATQELPTSG